MVRGLVISIALVTGACSDHELTQLTRARDEVCACKTAACAETAMKQVPQGNVKPTRREQQIARDMVDCLSKLYDQNRPTTDPDAPQGSAQ